MTYLICLTISFVITTAAVAFGADKLLKKRIPLYFQLFLAAGACYALQSLSCLVTEFCGGENSVISVSTLGLWGCLWFMFCANRGAMNGLIADGKKPASWIYVVSFVYALAILFVAYSYYSALHSVFTSVLMVVLMAPAVPVLFWNVEHLTAKEDALGLRSKISGCDKASIAFNIMLIGLCYAKVAGEIFAAVFTVLAALAMCWLVLSARKGAEQWNI